MESIELKNNRPQSSKSTNKVYPSVANNENELEKNENKTEEAVPERSSWGGKLEFFLSALSYSVGLGAVWRFPYLCYRNGGGAFLIPFALFLFIVGVPIMFMELSVGQFTNRGPVLSWYMIPIFRGVGLSMNIINNYVNIYYILIIGYSLYYLVLSLNSTLPWEKCNPKWASENCVDNFDPSVFRFIKNCTNENLGPLVQCDNGKCFFQNFTTDFNGNYNCSTNNTEGYLAGYWDPIYPSQDYFFKVILQKTETMDDTGGLVWQLVIALFAAWIVCFLCLFRGVKLSGKIVYFTALFPYLVLFILGIRGWILPGANVGIDYYIRPDLSRLSDSDVWKDAAVQVFFTLSLSYGGLIALSSYNKYNHNILRDTIILSISNFLTCLLAGFVVFAYMGYLSETTGLDIDKVVQGGQGLVYIVYPFAATTIAASPLWSVMFFVMMIALGMGTMMASVETLTTSLEDFFPYLKKNGWIKAANLGVCCLIFFLIGLVLCTRAGTYWVELFDDSSASWGIFLVGITECVSIGWFFGVERFKVDISTMIPQGSQRVNHYLFYWWKICWMFITPGVLFALTIFTWINTSTLGDEYPYWSLVLGNILSATSVSGIIGWAIWEVYKAKKENRPLAELFRPDPVCWRPSGQKDYETVLEARSKTNLWPRTNRVEKF